MSIRSLKETMYIFIAVSMFTFIGLILTYECSMNMQNKTDDKIDKQIDKQREYFENLYQDQVRQVYMHRNEIMNSCIIGGRTR